MLDIPRGVLIWEGFAQVAESCRTCTLPVLADTRPIPYDPETDIVYFNMFGADMIVLNSSETIADLLDKRSAIYSDKVTAGHPFHFV